MCQFHHDGGFSNVSPPPPALVQMYCEERPTKGSSVLEWESGETLPYAAGSTLFYSTRLEGCNPDANLLERVRTLCL